MLEQAKIIGEQTAQKVMAEGGLDSPGIRPALRAMWEQVREDERLALESLFHLQQELVRSGVPSIRGDKATGLLTDEKKKLYKAFTFEQPGVEPLSAASKDQLADGLTMAWIYNLPAEESKEFFGAMAPVNDHATPPKKMKP